MKRILPSATLVLALGTSAWAQGAKPNFSGTWNLDTAKSDFGPMPALDSMVLVVEHNDPELKISSTQKSAQMGEITNERRITTDGKPNTNKMRNMMGEQDVTSTTTWNGSKLATAATMDFQGNKIELSDSWELSEDGKMLTLVRKLKSDDGEIAQKFVFNKK
jgi:hypothetical protein